MAFHVALSSGLQRARSFNLGEDELRQTVLQPWLSRRPFELGDQRWDPEQSELLVLEGPNLSNPELSFGQGWANAVRASEEVTERVLETARDAQPAGGPTALVIETTSAVQTVAELASAHGARPVDPGSVDELIDGRDPEVAAIVLVIQRQPGQ
jgi:hypothetical protein